MGMQSVPNVNLYLGLGKNTTNMMDLIETFSEEETIKNLGDGYYRYDQSMMLIKDNSVVMHSSDTLKEAFKIAPIQSVAEMKDFGSKPLSLFVNLKKLVDSELNTTAGQYDMMLSLTDYLRVTGDNNEIIVKLVMKNQNDNILKQLVDVFEEDLKNQVGKVSF
jgi:hypothetical protein